MSTCLRRVGVLCSVMLLSSVALAQQAAPSLESYVPTDATMHFYYQGLHAAGPAFKGTALVDIINEPEFQQYGKEIVRFTDLALQQHLPDPTMVRWDDIRTLLDCEAIFVVSQNGDHDHGALLVLRPNDKREDVRAFVDRMMTSALGPNKPPMVTIQGVDFLSIGPARLGWKGDDLLIGDPDLVTRALSACSGAAPSLATDPAFQKLKKKLAPTPEFFHCSIDIDGLIKSSRPNEDDLAIIRKLGLDSCSKVYLNVTPDAPGMKIRVYTVLTKGVTGVWKFLPRDPVDPKRVLANIPEDSSCVLVSRTGLNDCVDLINLLISTQEETTINGIVKKAAGFDIFAELTPALNNDMTFEVIGSGAVLFPEFYVSVGVKDNASCRKALDHLLEALAKTPALADDNDGAPFRRWRPSASMSMDRIEYKGHTIDAVKFTGVPLMLTPSLMLTSDRLYIACIPQTLKKLVDRQPTQGKFLLDNPFFIASRSHVATNASLLSYSDPRKGFPALYGGLITYFAQMANAIPEVPPHGLATRLPSANAVSPHLIACFSAVSFDGEGFLCESYGTLGGIESSAGDFQSAGVAQVGILAGFLLPALSQSQSSARRASCLNNERQIMLSLIQYAGENDDKFPDSFAPLLHDGYLNTPKVFFCPDRGGAGQRLAGFAQKDFDKAPLDELKKIDDLSDYVLAKGVQHTDDADMIVVYEKDGAHRGAGRNCAYNDGHVQWVPEAMFQQLIEAQNKKIAAKDKGM